MQATAVSNDGELLTSFVGDNDRAAFDQIVARHARMVLRVCRRITGNLHDAEDAAQQVFAALSTRAQQLRQRHSLAGWLHWTAWHTAMKHRRDLRVRRHYENQAATHLLQATPDPHREEVSVEVDRALSRLPDVYREILILHHLEGLTVEEAAARIGCPTGTAASRLSRGRGMLRSKLAEFETAFPVVVLAALMGDEFFDDPAHAAEIPTTDATLWEMALSRDEHSLRPRSPRFAEETNDLSTALHGSGIPPAFAGASCATAKAASLSMLISLKVATLVLVLGGACTSTGRCFAQTAWSFMRVEAARFHTFVASDIKPSLADAKLEARARESSGSYGSSNVPEPSALAALGLATLGLLRRHRRPHRKSPATAQPN